VAVANREHPKEELRARQNERSKELKSDRINEWTEKGSTDVRITGGGKFSPDSALT
jgi:hypothetical protein